MLGRSLEAPVNDGASFLTYLPRSALLLLLYWGIQVASIQPAELILKKVHLAGLLGLRASL